MNSTRLLQSKMHSRTFEDRLIQFLFVAFIVMKPFYFWKSGLPQVSDFIYVALILALPLRFNFKQAIAFLSKRKEFLWAAIFAFHVVVVNAIWAVILNNFRMLVIPTIFYVYNVLVFTTVLIMANRYQVEFLRIFLLAVFLSVVLQAVFFFIGGGYSGGRETANFNNPNQLGYYGLLAMASLFFVSSRIKLNRMQFLLLFILSAVFVLASLSKAAIVSMVAMVMLYMMAQLKNRINRRFIILFTICIIIFAVYATLFGVIQMEKLSLVNSAVKRVQAIGQDSDDSLEGRGYDRIWKHPEYWIFGAGEGMFSRFSGFLSGAEFHSTLGNIQVSYGLFGTVFFLLVLYYCLRTNSFSDWYLVFGIMLYGLTHNGIRNTLLWILIAMISAKAFVLGERHQIC